MPLIFSVLVVGAFVVCIRKKITGMLFENFVYICGCNLKIVFFNLESFFTWITLPTRNVNGLTFFLKR